MEQQIDPAEAGHLIYVFAAAEPARHPVYVAVRGAHHVQRVRIHQILEIRIFGIIGVKRHQLFVFDKVFEFRRVRIDPLVWQFRAVICQLSIS